MNIDVILCAYFLKLFIQRCENIENDTGFGSVRYQC